MRRILLVLIIFSLTGCVGLMIDSSIRQYDEVADQISLGDSKEHVVSILAPTQSSLPGNSRKRPDQFMKEGVTVYIYYARTGRQPDGLTTDDEFTPYVFEDGKLVAIGWAALGGPPSQGQAVSDTYINVKQSTTVY